MPHSSRSLASESTDPIKANHTLPTASSDPLDMSLHPEKSNESTLPQTTSPVRFPSYPPASNQPDSLSRGVDQGSTTSLPLSQTFDALLPVAGPQLEHSTSRDSPFQSSSTETSKRRPLPTPPLMLQHSPSSSELHHISDPIPSSPPPPYSMSLPGEGPAPMTRDLSRIFTTTSHTNPAPEAPVIMPPLPNDQGSHGRAPYDSFLCHSPPANTWIAVETSQYEYVLLVRLPGFRRDGMLVYFLSISDLFTHLLP